MLKLVKKQIKKASNLIIIWAVVGISFGVVYYLLSGDLTFQNGQQVNNLLDAIYFSFITILTTGYGDIVPHGLIRALAAIEGLVGWILFGIIVYKVVTVKEDEILKEIHHLSNDQYLSRVRNYLFISNTNLIRFIKRVESKKLRGEEAIYELGVISTTLRSNVEDATRFICRSKNSISNEIDKEELVLLIENVKNCTSGLMKAIKLLPKTYSKNEYLMENISKIVHAGENIYSSCNIRPKDKRTKQLKEAYTQLKKTNMHYEV